MSNGPVSEDRLTPEHNTPQYQRGEYIPGAGKVGVMIFIASLAMLFSASMVGYLVIRLQAGENWPPPFMPPLPKQGLAVSTVVLMISSLTHWFASRSIRRGNQTGLLAGLILTTLLGVAFLVLQWINWSDLIQMQMAPGTKNLYAFTFYMLTGLHALHIIGGLMILTIVTIKASRDTYSPQYHPGVEYSSLYWHFLDIIWLIIFFVLVVYG
ncbi:MAG: cytochrome c oxidase subunit 3 [bacterium]